LNERILERRLNCLEYYFLGVKSSEWIPVVAKRYGVKPQAIRSDWTRRSKWIPNLQNQLDSQARFSERLVLLDTLTKKAYAMTRTADNDSAKIGAIRTCGALIGQYFDIMTAHDLEDLKERIEHLEEAKGK
jgi:hypothetical protein